MGVDLDHNMFGAPSYVVSDSEDLKKKIHKKYRSSSKCLVSSISSPHSSLLLSYLPLSLSLSYSIPPFAFNGGHLIGCIDSEGKVLRLLLHSALPSLPSLRVFPSPALWPDSNSVRHLRRR